jgi:hypothetical protein
MARPHPPEFRARAVELAREHAKPLEQIANDLGISDARRTPGSCVPAMPIVRTPLVPRRPGTSQSWTIEIAQRLLDQPSSPDAWALARRY